MTAGTGLLEQLIRTHGAEDTRAIRLDLTPRMLRIGLEAGRFAVGGAHIATSEDVRNNYAEDALVPDMPEPLSSRHYELLKPFLAGKGTPGSLRIGYGALPRELDTNAVLAEVSPGFRPYRGEQLHDLGRYGSGCVIDILENEPGQPDTIVAKDHGEHLTEKLPFGRLLGIHYDNSAEQPPDGWTERLSRDVRLQAGRRLLVPVEGVEGGPRKALAGLNFSALQFADEYRPDKPDFLPTAPDLAGYCARHPKRLAEMTILWTEIEPGEVAEIVPANAAHTGSMLGCSEPSTALIFTMSNLFKRV